MPENEINAPFYIKGKYATPAYPAGHAFRLYFAAGTTLSGGVTGDEDNWRINFDGGVVGTIAGMVDNLFDRAATILPASTSISLLEVWQSVPSEPNLLVHLNTLPPSNSYGSGAGVASAYAMYVFSAALRQKFRFTLFDGALVSPQRYAPPALPILDNGSVAWFFLRSNYPMATNDGLRLVVENSENAGYNRKLAKSYGRTIAP